MLWIVLHKYYRNCTVLALHRLLASCTQIPHQLQVTAKVYLSMCLLLLLKTSTSSHIQLPASGAISTAASSPSSGAKKLTSSTEPSCTDTAIGEIHCTGHFHMAMGRTICCTSPHHYKVSYLECMHVITFQTQVCWHYFWCRITPESVV